MLKISFLLIIIAILFVMVTGNSTPSYGKAMSANIRFTGEAKNKAQAIKLVDQSLKLHGNFVGYGDLSRGLKSVMKESSVEIVDMIEKYQVYTSPKSGAGHDFSFQVDKNTGFISDVVVGNLLPPPSIKE